MSATISQKSVTTLDLADMKARSEKIAMLTAYDFTSAILAERAGVPVLLVGDSLGMVVHGHGTTLPVTVDDMVRHAAAVVRGAGKALVIADLPFLSYADEASAVRSAGRLLQEAGVAGVKLEGGASIASIVRKLVDLGIPVMGHIGFTPQSVNQIGLKVQGKAAADARRMLEDALALQEAGAFAVVIELAPAALAAEITKRLTIPTIGIGAGAGCDGQVQVWHDILGLYGDKPPRHAKQFADVGAAIEGAVKAYADEVRGGSFPTDANSSKIDPAELAEALKGA
ncbi:3-methyl-2-oxobutanoate hydroxymethyltransferase [Caulobacter segnis]|uniref:3-methyl-2-oxobutanoate hydroxymethyltransferase n=1 Tax=Caulobacter segnis TaxID=88688 RepID=UPI00240FE0DE|nr:3-methyl-2-oxobutanoate hydroxymethyltransferase [Caulobacter segnis]MDG2522412.1 3-methyl-2-oxobutanoate hydroxymethyltransferase [Caulobacter segnis]